MIELKLKNRKGNFHVNSKEVKDILDARQDIGYLQDISNSINQDNIMVFDCELSERVFSKEEILEAIEELGESVDESFFEIIFDDVRRFLKTRLTQHLYFMLSFFMSNHEKSRQSCLLNFSVLGMNLSHSTSIYIINRTGDDNILRDKR